MAVPEPTVILFATGDSPRTVTTLREMAGKGVHASERPLSSQVLKWTPAGWDVLSP